MIQTWDDQLRVLGEAHNAFKRSVPGSSRRFESVLCNTLVQVETPTQLGQVLRLLRDRRTAGLAYGPTTISNWERGLNPPIDEQVLRKHVLSLNMPDTTLRYWDNALKSARQWARKERQKNKAEVGNLDQPQPAKSSGDVQSTPGHEVVEAPEPEVVDVGGLQDETPVATTTPQADQETSSQSQPSGVVLKRFRWSWRDRRPVWVGGIAVVVALIVGGILVLPSNWRSRPEAGETPAASTQPPSPGAKGGPSSAAPGESMVFTSPSSGAGVTSPLTLHGRGAIAPRHHLWILLRAEGGDPRYFVTTDSAVAIDSDGNWSSNLRLGRGPQDEGFSYHLYAVSSPVGGTIEGLILVRPKGQYSVRLTDIPSDATMLTGIEIKLVKYKGR